MPGLADALFRCGVILVLSGLSHDISFLRVPGWLMVAVSSVMSLVPLIEDARKPRESTTGGEHVEAD